MLMLTLGELVENLLNFIFLQIGEECSVNEDFNSLCEITWSKEKVNNC